MENEKIIIENIIRDGAKSFSGKESTKHWTDKTIWFDAAPVATKGIEKAKKMRLLEV